MKKTSLTILVLSISILSLAQTSADSENQSRSSCDLENQFYFRFGYSLPTTSYLGVDDEEFWDYFTRNGGVFEFGQIFIINKAALSDGLRIGFNVDYAEFSYHHLNFSDEDFSLGLLKLASKIGPSLSYSPASKLVFDVFVKAKIPWVAGMVTYSDNMKFESQDYPGEYFGNLGDGTDKTPMPSLSFTLGFCF